MSTFSSSEEELGPEVVDSEFVALVRRYRPSSLVPLLAQVAAQHMPRESWLESRQPGLYAPWVLAEVARVSLAHGNEHRQVATMADLTRCCAAFTAVGDPQLASGDPKGLSSFLLRTAEQLEYQADLYLEMSRTAALFDQTETETNRPAKVLTPGWQRELFGASLADFVGAGQLLHFACRPNDGIFDPTWLDAPQLAEITAVMDPSVLRQVWRENYLTDVAGFRAANGRPRSRTVASVRLQPARGHPGHRRPARRRTLDHPVAGPACPPVQPARRLLRRDAPVGHVLQ